MTRRTHIALTLGISVMIVAACCLMANDCQADWPVYRHDSRRSGISAEKISAERLQLKWMHDTDTIPQTAWSGAAKYDAFGNVKNLKSMRNYDPVFHPIIAEGKVLFGSTVDHGVHCLDLATGKPLWDFYTNGAVRIAPTAAAGKVYFGSDDGSLYCIALQDGRLHWRYTLPIITQHVIHEGNVISQWPCRTGVLVEGNTVYAAFSMLPWKSSYLVALNAETGALDPKTGYMQEYPGPQGLTLEGPLLAADDQLIVPQGRVAPLVFRRSDGKSLGSLPGGGGCMVLIGDDGRVFHGPGNKGGEIYVTQGETRSRLASYQGGTAMVAEGSQLFVLTERELISIPDKQAKVAAWKQPINCNLELIKAGEYLIAGGLDRVLACRAVDGKPVWQGKVQGRAYGMAAAQESLVISTDEGKLYMFGQGDQSAATKLDEPIAHAATPLPTTVPAEAAFAPLVGPSLRFIDAETAQVEWETEQPMPTIVDLIHEADTRRINEPRPKTQHQVVLDRLRKDALYHYQITLPGDVPKLSQKYECDQFFNPHANQTVGSATNATANRNAALQSLAPELKLLVQQILMKMESQQGLCIDWGCGDGYLAAALAKTTGWRVIGFDDNLERVNKTRSRLKEQGIYGKRVVIHYIPALAESLRIEQCADFVVSEAALLKQTKIPAEVLSLIRPGGHGVLGAEFQSPVSKEYQAQFAVSALDGEQQAWRHFQRKQSPGQGLWTHQYGTADNSAFGGESLGGVAAADELRVQWLGRPGPRAQADRSGRKPSPLAVGGKLFVQGLNRITAVNSYNGDMLWRLEIPDFSRFNVPRDSSNWCADDQFLYTVIRDHCWKIRAADGVVEQHFKVQSGYRSDWKYDWGYVACDSGVLLGSCVKQDTRHTDYWGGAGWYDDKQGPATYPICSDRLFALDPADGKLLWSREQQVILNSTITIADKKVYFIESRHPKLKELESHRVGMKELWQDQYLVAMDLQSGRVLWEQPIDTADGIVMFHLAAGSGKLVLLSSLDRYYVYAFDATDGRELWKQQFDWPSDNHGGHMSRPAIVGEKIFIRPRTLELKTGELLPDTMPGGGCGSYAATEKSLVFRAGNVTMWDVADNSFSNWHRLRPDCWISTIPADGMLLSPEGGGGCSCGSWLETSLGFMPEPFPPPKIAAKTINFVDHISVELISRGRSNGVTRYTLDGLDPTEDSPIYNKPLQLKTTTRLKARTFWAAGDSYQAGISPVNSQQFTRVYPAPNITPRSIPFVDGIAVDLTQQSQSGVIHYTLDGSDVTLQSPVYRTPLKLKATTTLKTAIHYDDGVLGSVQTEQYNKIDTPWNLAVDVQKPDAGLICRAYEGNWDKLPDFSKEKPKQTVVVPKISLATRTAGDSFGLQFQGYIKVPVDGVYVFYTRSDDGSNLYIGDTKVVDNDGVHGAQERKGWIALKAGFHKIRIDYWDAVWDQSLEVQFEGPGVFKQQLPAAVLFHSESAAAEK